MAKAGAKRYGKSREAAAVSHPPVSARTPAVAKKEGEGQKTLDGGTGVKRIKEK
jgi:hypothetical protein